VNYIRAALSFVILFTLTGCMIKGVKNTNAYATLPSNGTYALILDSGDDITAPRIEKMLDYQMRNLGLSPAQNVTEADVHVRWAFDVVPMGSTSTAFTSIQPGRATANIVGNTAYIRSRPGTATTFTSTSDNYQKTIAVKMIGRSGQKLWEGRVTEVGWCNQIFVTSPHILSLLFDKFPVEAINVTEEVNDNPQSDKFKKLFPENTNWGCR